MSKTSSKKSATADHIETAACCASHGEHEPQTQAVLKPLTVQKTKLEKTQSLLTVISTSIGLLGIAGSTFAFAASTFYTGSIDVRPDFETPGMVVKVFTSEGHQSVFHTKHINLMPGTYHLEISSPNGKVVHRDSKIHFHKTNVIDVKLGPPPADSVETPAQAQASAAAPEAQNPDAGNTSTTAPVSTSTTDPRVAENSQAIDAQNNSSENQTENPGEAPKKKRWWQVWKRGG